MWRTYTNNTNIIRSFFDAHGNPITVGVSETVEYLAKIEVPIVPTNGKGISTPPIGMQGIYNLYRNPETEKVEMEFTDSPRI